MAKGRKIVKTGKTKKMGKYSIHKKNKNTKQKTMKSKRKHTGGHSHGGPQYTGEIILVVIH